MPDLDEQLVRVVDRLPRVGFSGPVHRHVGPSHPPMSAEGARIRGGRWNPPDSFPTLYLGLDASTVVAEFYRFAEKQGMPPENLLPRKLITCHLELSASVDFRDQIAWPELGLSSVVIESDDSALCQRLGDAAHYVGFEGILAPSATGSGDVVAVFTDRLRAGSRIDVMETQEWVVLP
jgi:RES domain-containing protein